MIVSEEQVQNVLKIQRELKAENIQASKTPLNKTELSKIASQLKLVKGSLSGAPEVRRERVSAIKDTITQGKYQPASSHIASKMVNRSLVDSTLVRVNFKKMD